MTQQTPDVVEIVGLVHPMGAGGGQLGGETTWTMRFSFALWRAHGGTLQERRLYLALPGVTREELNLLMAAVNGDEVIRVRLIWPPEETPRRWEALLLEILGPDGFDAELLARAEVLRQPVILPHRRLGPLTLDRRFDCYEATPAWNRRRIKLRLEREGCTDEAALVALAETLWQDQPGWECRLRDCAVEHLLALKNGTWLGDREKKFTPDRFKKRMKLESITLDATGSFTFYYEDGNLFWGHCILVEGTLADGPKDASIAG